MDVVIGALGFVWLMGALGTLPLIFMSEIALLLFRGPDYREWFYESLDRWKEESDYSLPAIILKLAFFWWVLFFFWVYVAFKGKSLLEFLMENEEIREEENQHREILYRRAAHKLTSRMGNQVWVSQVDPEQGIGEYLMLVCAGPLVASHLIQDDFQGNYTLYRCGDVFMMGEPISTQKMDEKPLSMDEALALCERDHDWLKLCREWDNLEGRVSFLEWAKGDS